MKFFLDESLPYSLKEVFEGVGEAIHTRDVNLLGSPDEEIFRFALESKSILVTRDLEFGSPKVYPQDSHYGIIVIRVPSHFTVMQMKNLCRAALPLVVERDLKQTVIVVQPGRVRFRSYKP